MDFSPDHIRDAKESLRKGRILLYPTDTIWGIGCDAQNSDAIDKVYRIKKRNDSKALICLVADQTMLEELVGEVHPKLLPYLNKNRPTTIIYPKVKNVSKRLLAEDGSIGIRVTKDSFCSSLIKSFGGPIVSTSANISGSESPSTFKEISHQILEAIDDIVPLRQNEKQNQASRILRLNRLLEIEILRP